MIVDEPCLGSAVVSTKPSLINYLLKIHKIGVGYHNWITILIKPNFVNFIVMADAIILFIVFTK